MSGTGNSYRASVWASETSGKKGISAPVVPMERPGAESSFTPGNTTLLGLFFPTHGFTAPWPTIKFAFKLPLGKGTQVFISASRAGWMVGRWRLPGLEGTATLLIALILGVGILLTIAGKPWLLIVAFAAYVVAFGRTCWQSQL